MWMQIKKFINAKEHCIKFLYWIASVPEPTVPTSEAPALPDTTDSDSLGTQLTERLLKLEEEKNNIINMEKQLKAEQVGFAE